MLELKNITKKFGERTILGNLNLEKIGRASCRERV